eukprot:TRINITY_DN5417_c0_g1_i2.p1 TRINITY_DN5417_c0_g1~~TRINITY_DN5417_c0_g1_i2.p1  ORF type:complete len:208 (+),score=39.85 TRINITY_DN5417_c0_g1_i2:51-626(+)
MGCKNSKDKTTEHFDIVNLRTPTEKTNRIKCVVIGTQAVGKTNLVLRYTRDMFNPSHEITLGAAFTVKEVNVEGKQWRINVWDTAGQEQYHSMTQAFFRESKFAVLCFGINDRASYEEIDFWFKLFKSKCPTAEVIVCANKCDLEPFMDFAEMKQEVFEKYQAPLVKCSSKEGFNVAAAFQLGTEKCVGKM